MRLGLHGLTTLSTAAGNHCPLAASADEQHAYLESILAHLTPNGDATGYGNDELALEFDGIYPATEHMRQWGEITQDEIDAAKPLEALLDRWSGPRTPIFGAVKLVAGSEVGTGAPMRSAGAQAVSR